MVCFCELSCHYCFCDQCVPLLYVHASLLCVGIKPIEEQWSPEASRFFNDHAEKQYYVFYKQISDERSSILFFAEGDVQISQKMIDKGFASTTLKWSEHWLWLSHLFVITVDINTTCFFIIYNTLIEFGIGMQIWCYSDINFAISFDNPPLISHDTFELTFENDDHYQFSYRECCVCELCLGWRSCWGLGLKWGWWGWTSGGTSTMSR